MEMGHLTRSIFFLILIALALTPDYGEKSEVIISTAAASDGSEAVQQERYAIDSVSVRAVTSGPKHHFFGYYGISPWNESRTRLLCLETDFQNRLTFPIG
ncbi:MAG: hypothetical protein C4520_18615 [Candidatus Abyssobacteria bacterium SURF_5]|jgi:hypothetical protein|uniref:Uncharacterized protein n=1 Tax=Abyssobacteria bacterium (strain SURF_5) TaxID=2093360 RepID=A0A3A4N1N4_ABYX5|nr:MAG: hypothetical protein C4520_18615 [Candidatus Abyssubacteria bacterium SURF_5]